MDGGRVRMELQFNTGIQRELNMKKTLCITLSLLFTLALSACGKADSPAPAVSGRRANCRRCMSSCRHRPCRTGRSPRQQPEPQSRAGAHLRKPVPRLWRYRRGTALLFTLALSACGKADSPAPAVSGSNPSNTPVVSVPDAGSQQGQPPSQVIQIQPVHGGKRQLLSVCGGRYASGFADNKISPAVRAKTACTARSRGTMWQPPFWTAV